MDKSTDIAMQHHCLNCLREQWAVAVYKISLGDGQCAWCGEQGVTMTSEEYYAALRKARAAEFKRERSV